MTGDDADRAVHDARHRSISRADLAKLPHFDALSPTLGELDHVVFDELLENEPDLALELLSEMAQATDRELAALARRLAGGISLDLTSAGPLRGGGVGRLLAKRSSEPTGDVDLDASHEHLVAAWAERRPPALDELFTTRWHKPNTAICLLVDRSGSMNGRRLACAALAAAVCSWRAPAQFAVLAFSDRVIELKGLDGTKKPEAVIADLLALKGHGTTDVSLALRAAHRQLAPSMAGRKLTVLLSDAEVTVGQDPVPSAHLLDELVLIAPADEPGHAEALAVATGSRMAEVDRPLSVLTALRRVME